MAEMHIHRGNSAIFLWNLSAFLLHSAWIEIFPGLYNFPDAYAILVITPSACTLHVDTPHSSMSPMQFPWHFHWSPLKHLCPIYFRKQVYFLPLFCFQCPILLVCHPRNLHSISTSLHWGTCIMFTMLFFCFQHSTILACHPHNLHRMSKGSSRKYLTRILTHYLSKILRHTHNIV